MQKVGNGLRRRNGLRAVPLTPAPGLQSQHCPHCLSPAPPRSHQLKECSLMPLTTPLPTSVSVGLRQLTEKAVSQDKWNREAEAESRIN